MMNHQQALTPYIAAFVSELVQTGVTDVVVSPGSRSTPIAMVMAEHPDLQFIFMVDERSAAFFALESQRLEKANCSTMYIRNGCCKLFSSDRRSKISGFHWWY